MKSVIVRYFSFNLIVFFISMFLLISLDNNCCCSVTSASWRWILATCRASTTCVLYTWSAGSCRRPSLASVVPTWWRHTKTISWGISRSSELGLPSSLRCSSSSSSSSSSSKGEGGVIGHKPLFYLTAVMRRKEWVNPTPRGLKRLCLLQKIVIAIAKIARNSLPEWWVRQWTVTQVTPYHKTLLLPQACQSYYSH